MKVKQTCTKINTPHINASLIDCDILINFIDYSCAVRDFTLSAEGLN